MPGFKGLARIAARQAVEKSPVILTAVGAAGVISTAVLAVKATPGAHSKIQQERTYRAEIEHSSDLEEPYVELTKFEVVKLVWRDYLPAVGMAGATISAIVLANTISTRRTAAIATAYSLSNEAFKNYRESVVEKIGVKQEEEVRSHAGKRYLENNPPSREVLIEENGKILCLESYSQRYFYSDKQEIRKVMNDINEMIINSEYAALNDFYRKIGLAATSYGDEVGWNQTNMLDIVFSSALDSSDKPCLVIDYTNAPDKGYYKVW